MAARTASAGVPFASPAVSGEASQPKFAREDQEPEPVSSQHVASSYRALATGGAGALHLPGQRTPSHPGNLTRGSP